MILIGSRALMLRASALCMREPEDFDFICTKHEFDEWLKANESKVKPKKVYPELEGRKMIVEGASNCEFEIINTGTSAAMLDDIVRADKDTINTSFGMVPNLDLLFTIKASHKYLKNSPHFWKTLLDYHFLKHSGAKVRPEYMEFLKLREKETYTYAHPKLNQGKQSFFADDAVVYTYDHDTIHKSVAMFDVPAYTKYMKDGQEVQCDKAKFLACPREIQLAGVVEEAAVLAIERSLVPHPGVWTPEYAWRFALSKVCSSITSGWFRAFAYENALDVLKLYTKNYWDKFNEDVKSGLVRRL